MKQCSVKWFSFQQSLFLFSSRLAKLIDTPSAPGVLCTECWEVLGVEESFRWFHTLFAVWRAGFWNFALNPWCAVLFESAVWNYFPKNREHGTHIALLASPMQAVGSWDSFITWPIHNSPLKFRGRSPSMNTQRHYCGQKWAGLVNTILFILKKFFS